MKTDFRRLALAILALPFLSACGSPRTSTSTFEKPSASCADAAMAKQFLVKRFDGGVEVVRANSAEEFVNGYLSTNLKDIAYAEHDFRVKVATGDFQALAAETGYADNWGPARIEASTLWSQEVRGEGVLVAVIDTGVDLTHPQLAAQIYVSPGESGLDSKGHNKSSNGIDDDGNGFIDDVNGYDFVHSAPLSGDDYGHGTHVAGIIAAAHSDSVASGGSHVQGVAPKARILGLKFLDADGGGSLSDGVRAIKYAAAAGANVINASWGGPECSRTMRDEIEALATKNIAIIVAAGNSHKDLDFSPEYPAALGLDSQITVGAVGDHDEMARYSNYGAKAVHIFAPGSNIVSTWPGGRMAFSSGTSMAAPFVTGAVALLRGAVPEATVAQIRAALYNSAAHSTSYISVSQGRMNLATALSELHQVVGH